MSSANVTNQPAGDCKVPALFQKLNKLHITAKENFLCCRTCGAKEIHDHKRKRDVGYCFYHAQDTESAAETGQLYLRFSAYDADLVVQVGELIVDTARKLDLDVEWSGDPDIAILLKGLPKDYFAGLMAVEEWSEESLNE